jgi:hypothetical protein
MQGLSAALQLAGWIGRKGRGTARLRWDGRDLVLHVNALHVVGAEGDDGDVFAAAFGPASEVDWFRQARGAVGSGLVSETEAVAVVKRALRTQLAAFFLAEGAEVTFEPGIHDEESGFTLSYPHIVTELVLGTGGERYVPIFLADPDLVLRRLPDFPRRVGALQLTDEAMAILAKINDLRSAREIAEPSPHGRETVLRLIAAAIGAGLLEGVPGLADMPLVAAVADAAAQRSAGTPPRRRRWPWFLLVAVLLVALGIVTMWLRPWEAGTAGSGGPWAIAVDGGCQPAELERLYRRHDQDPGRLAVVPFGSGDERCFRLVWGHFPDQATATAALANLPDGLVTRGFTPHVVKVEPKRP